MKLLLAVTALLMLVGCDNGHYQIAGGQGGVWRVDTRTGEVMVCGFFRPDDSKITCISSNR